MISSNHHQVASTPHLSPATTGAALLACERHPLALMTLRQLLGEVEELGPQLTADLTKISEDSG